jgi:hypothetical protein
MYQIEKKHCNQEKLIRNLALIRHKFNRILNFSYICYSKFTESVNQQNVCEVKYRIEYFIKLQQRSPRSTKWCEKI